jgi:hypothetical protein
LDHPVDHPASLPAGDVVVHEVLADESVGYTRQDEVLVGELGGHAMSACGSALTARR